MRKTFEILFTLFTLSLSTACNQLSFLNKSYSGIASISMDFGSLKGSHRYPVLANLDGDIRGPLQSYAKLSFLDPRTLQEIANLSFNIGSITTPSGSSIEAIVFDSEHTQYFRAPSTASPQLFLRGAIDSRGLGTLLLVYRNQILGSIEFK